MIETSDPLTAGTPDILRRVGPPAAPWPAGLVRTPTGPALLVGLDELSDAAFGPPAEHVLRPLDVFRTADGHLALLPALARPLAPGAHGLGASVTLAVSIIRGLGEAGAHARGRWWLTEAGTPVFVPVRDGDPAAPSAVALVRALAGPAPSDVFAELAVELERPEELDEVAVAQWEERLFGLASPAPVTTSPAGEDVSRRRRRSEPAPGFVRSLLRSFDAPLAEAVSDAVTSLRRRVRGLRGRRAPALIAAGTAAIMVLIVGLSWPEGDDRPRVDSPSTAASVRQSAAPSAVGPPSSAAHARPDPVEAARDLLTRLRSCDDLSCRAGVLEDPATVVPDGVALTAAGATLSVVDDLGGISVVRADAAGVRSQLIVMVARNDSWLVRDVYDAADQP